MTIKDLICQALLCLTATTMSAQNTATDSLDFMKEAELKGVVVKGRTLIQKTDRRVVIPTQAMKSKSADGIDLLRLMSLPGISINPTTMEISAIDGGETVLCMNGVKTTPRELASLPMDDIIRIEYIENPGARYGNAGVVINYVMRRKESGGAVSSSVMKGMGNTPIDIDHLTAKHSHGKSQFTANADFFRLKRDQWIRDYEETRVYDDRQLTRKEKGMPMPTEQNMLRSNINYSIADDGRYFFNARLNYDWSYTPASETGNRHTQMSVADADCSIDIYEELKEKTYSPSLDLYLQYNTGKGQQLLMNLVGTIISTDNIHKYAEHFAAGVPTDLISTADGTKKSLYGEAVYEWKITGGHKLSVGFSHEQSFTHNRYGGNTIADICMRQALTRTYAEYTRNWEKVGIRGSLSVRRLYSGQSVNSISHYSMQPALSLNYRPWANCYARYSINIDTEVPSLSVLSDVEQIIDTEQIRRGNPNLKPFQTLRQQLSLGGQWSIVNADITLGYKHEYNPIMESVDYDAQRNLFIRQYDNQRSFSELSVGAALSVKPLGEHLVIALLPHVSRYFSRGCNYSHTQNISIWDWSVDGFYKGFTLGIKQQTGHDNYMYGEQLTKEKSMIWTSLGYRAKQWNITAMVYNPFSSRYYMKTYDYSAAMNSTAYAYTNRKPTFIMRLAFNLSYGGKLKNHEQIIRHSDTDAGIMKSTRH